MSSNENSRNIDTTSKIMSTPASGIINDKFYSSTAIINTSPRTLLNVADLSASLQHFGLLDYLVFIMMLIVCAIVGFYFGFIERKHKRRVPEERRCSEELDYLVGGRKMKVLPVSLSLVAR